MPGSGKAGDRYIGLRMDTVGHAVALRDKNSLHFQQGDGGGTADQPGRAANAQKVLAHTAPPGITIPASRSA